MFVITSRARLIEKEPSPLILSRIFEQNLYSVSIFEEMMFCDFFSLKGEADCRKFEVADKNFS